MTIKKNKDQNLNKNKIYFLLNGKIKKKNQFSKRTKKIKRIRMKTDIKK